MADSVKIRITGDDSGYRKALGGIGSATKSVLKGLTVATTAVSAAWAAVGAVGVKYNSEIESLQTSFEVMTGSAEKAAKITEQLRKIGAETPFDLKGLASTTKLLMNYGIEADRAVDEMMMLGDIAQGNAEAMNSVALGYAQMSSLGKVNLQDIKQMINGGFNPLQEISERTGESMEKLYERISKGTMAVSEITESMKHATSEGGKYYQSMEKQAQTFQGRLDTLKEDATAFAGQIMGSVSGGLRDSAIPMASEMLAGFSDAFSAGGLDGLIDAITAKIPVLIDKAIAMIKQGISGLTKWLPSAIKQIATVIPSAIRAIVDVAPQIVQSLFEVAGSLVGDLITMLPELVPMILEGVGKMLLSIGSGVGKLLLGVFNGIEDLLGLKGDEMTDAINGLFSKVDTKRSAELSAKVKATLSTEISTDDYTTKINDAVAAIATALANVSVLDESTRAKIKAAIISGTGLDLLSSAFAEAFPGVDMTPITEAMATINTTLEGLGLTDAAKTKVNELIASGATTPQIATALESFGVNPETAATTAATMTTAMSNINAELEKLGLTETAKTKMADIIAQGASAGEIESALVSFGIPVDTAKTAAESITAEMGLINTAMNGLGLDKNALTGIAKLAKAGATSKEIAAALVEYGVTENVAKDAADTITTEMGLINAAVDGLGLPEGTGEALSASAISDKTAIITALKLYGLTDEQIQPILGSYDAVSGSLTAKAKLLLDQIATTFTDGLPDDETKAKDAVKAFYKNVYEKIDAWKAEAIAELEASGLTGSALEEKTAAIEGSWSSMVAAAKESETSAMGWVEENANRSTKFVQGNLAALQTILDEAQQITAQIDVLTNKAFDTARSRRTLVKKGAVKSEEHQLEALGITSAELEERLQNAELEAAKAFDEAAEDFSNDSKGYAEEEKRILDQLAADKSAAYTTYNTEVAAIIAGIVKSDPELAERLGGLQELSKTAEEASALRQKIADALSGAAANGEPVDMSGFFDNLTAEGIDTAKIAELLGMTPEELQTAIANELKGGEGGGPVTTAINDLISGTGGIEEQIAANLKEGGIDLAGTGIVLTAAIDSDYLKAGIDGVDWTNYETLFNTMMAGIGQSGIDGLSSKETDAKTASEGVITTAATAMDGKDELKKSGENTGDGWLEAWEKKSLKMKLAAYKSGRDVKTWFDKGQNAQSPSRAFMQSGMWSGQGYEIGLKKSMGDAVKTARSLGSSIVGAVNLPMRFAMPDIAQTITDVMTAADTQATPVYLDSHQIASIQRNNNNVAITRHNRRVLMGYGGK